MPKSRPPYPPAFRRQMVELVRAGGVDLRLKLRINELEKISGVHITLCQPCVTEWPDV